MTLIAVAQINSVVGDLRGNRRRIAAAAARAAARRPRADVLVTPELSLCGYTPEDLLRYPAFVREIEKEFRALCAELPRRLAVVVGLPMRASPRSAAAADKFGGGLFNGAAVVRDGRVICAHRKQMLPNFSVFDEARHFIPAPPGPSFFSAGGARLALFICADAWEQNITRAARAADAFIVCNASPFHAGKQAARKKTMAKCGAPVVYCNLVGGQDDLVFDGASFAQTRAGRAVLQLPAFAESDGAVSLTSLQGEKGFAAVYPPAPKSKAAPPVSAYPSTTAALYVAVKTALADFAAKNKLRGAVLGLSGGVDSALAAALAADALGKKNVRAIMLPSKHTSKASVEDAKKTAALLGISYEAAPIDDAVAALHTALRGRLKARAGDVSAENLQARVRGTMLMAVANNAGLLLLATGNKSETACGYATLYGDMAGGYAPLKDLTKTQVWTLARFRNRLSPAMPPRVISRAPTAELRAHQKDEDELPPYKKLDAALAEFMEQSTSPRALAARHGQTAKRLLALIHASEHKRRQAAPGPRVSARDFGRDWRMPVASGYRYEEK